MTAGKKAKKPTSRRCDRIKKERTAEYKTHKQDRREKPRNNSYGPSYGSYDRREKDYYQEEAPSNLIIGRNPVMEALKNDREIDKLMVIKGGEGSIIKITAMARDKGIPVYMCDKIALDRLSAGGVHQGVAAFASEYSYSTLEDIYKKAEEQGEEPFIMILDNLEDPHNLGAIMRTAECAGAHGVVIPKRRSCGLTETVAKTSAGAIEYVPVVRVPNIGQFIDQIKEDGFWICACDMGEHKYYEQDLTGKLAVVIGSEGDGISRLVKEKCDFTVSMPMVGKITSLNASNAAAVIMYEVRKQRDGKKESK